MVLAQLALISFLLNGMAEAFLPSASKSSTTTHSCKIISTQYYNHHHVDPPSTSTSSPTHTALKMISASELLYQDQQEAMLRRAIREEELLSEKKQPKELIAPKLKAKPPKSGTGFANTAAMDITTRLAAEQCKVLKRDGVLRVNNVLSAEVAERLRQHLLDQQKVAEEETRKDPRASQMYYGVEQARKNRCDLHLSLRRGGIQTSSSDDDDDNDNETTADQGHVVADALQEILGVDGTLRSVYENLVSTEGEFYELAGIITNPGSSRQMIHPDLPFQKTAPLYVVFLALQDVTEEMGPTSFLLKTHTDKAIKIFEGGGDKDEQLRGADCRLATLKQGDAALFDARILHAGGANDAEEGATRIMFNFSFRNPKVSSYLGYKGSIMPGYVGAMTLGDIGGALVKYSEGEQDPFAQYGDGILN
ncbi:hypothetical protein ACHAXR_007902 [Thalassiosira sp. AJA248-18]